jgi:hypothetical protein
VTVALLALLALLALGPLAPALRAQATAADSTLRAKHAVGALPRYGKWVLLLGAAGLSTLAATAHHDANQIFGQLQDICFTTPERCRLGSNGAYLDPESESLYQRTVSRDRTARTWLILGETALAGSAAIFIYELTRPKGLPANKPFVPEVKRENGATKVGLRLQF